VDSEKTAQDKRTGDLFALGRAKDTVLSSAELAKHRLNTSLLATGDMCDPGSGVVCTVILVTEPYSFCIRHQLRCLDAIQAQPLQLLAIWSLTSLRATTSYGPTPDLARHKPQHGKGLAAVQVAPTVRTAQ
jgi:hypothetical protein